MCSSLLHCGVLLTAECWGSGAVGVDLQASPRQVPAVAGSALLLQASPVDNLRVVSSVVMVFGPCMLWGPCLSAYRYQVFPLKPSHLTKLARLVSERSIYGTFSMGGGVTTLDGLSSCLGCHEPYLSAWPPAQVPSGEWHMMAEPLPHQPGRPKWISGLWLPLGSAPAAGAFGVMN